MLVVIATIAGKPDKREQLAGALAKTAAASRGESGCLSYRLTRDLENPDSYVSVETWADQDSLTAHFSAPHLVELLAQAPDLLEGEPEILTYESSGPQG